MARTYRAVESLGNGPSDDIQPGLPVTIRRRRRRALQTLNPLTHTFEEFYQVVEPGTITDVRRTTSGKVTAIEARNEVTGNVHWFTARRDELTRVHTGYFKKGLEQSKPYELLLQPFTGPDEA